jgi:dUTP pyrophosphatase
MPTLKVKTTLDKTKLPSKRDEDSAYDIYASPVIEQLLINPHQIILVPTDIRIAIPSGYTFLVKERGSSGTSGLAVRAGVVDSGYRGEIFVAVNNTTKQPIFIGTDKAFKDFSYQGQITHYDIQKAIAQGIIIRNENWEVEKVSELSESERGEGSLGSSFK